MSVLVVLTNTSEAASLSAWGWHIASNRGCDLVVVDALTSRAEPQTLSFTLDDTIPEDEQILSRAAAELRNLQEDAAPKEEADKERIWIRLRKLRSAAIHETLLAELKNHDSDLIIATKSFQGSSQSGESIAHTLFHEARCEVLLARTLDAEGRFPTRILVPVGGGPHATSALRIAAQLSTTPNSVTALYVEPEAVEEGEDVGEHIIKKALKRARLEDNPVISSKVILADKPDIGISREAENHDLIIMGASERGAIRRQLFSTIPDRVLRNLPSKAIAVARKSVPLRTRIKRSVEEWLDLTVPQMSREDRITLIDTLQNGSRWNFDFLALIGLSTLIAALGLIQNSTAVVIGAMLVAPLMTPLLGAGLALVQANQPLLLSASRSIAYGFLVAMALAFMLIVSIPIPELTSELLARGAPSLLDMMIGFFGGMAAAYCIARPTLSAALPGVAIAAALVPPIATVGIALGLGELTVAWGATFLFGTNVVAIILGAAISFYAGGIRGRAFSTHSHRWATRSLLGLILLAAAMTIPLGSVLLAKIAKPPGERELNGSLATSIIDLIKTESSVHRVSVRERGIGEKSHILISTETSSPLPNDLIGKIDALVQKQSKRKRAIRVESKLVQKNF